MNLAALYTCAWESIKRTNQVSQEKVELALNGLCSQNQVRFTNFFGERGGNKVNMITECASKMQLSYQIIHSPFEEVLDDIDILIVDTEKAFVGEYIRFCNKFIVFSTVEPMNEIDGVEIDNYSGYCLI